MGDDTESFVGDDTERCAGDDRFREAIQERPMMDCFVAPTGLLAMTVLMMDCFVAPMGLLAMTMLPIQHDRPAFKAPG